MIGKSDRKGLSLELVSDASEADSNECHPDMYMNKAEESKESFWSNRRSRIFVMHFNVIQGGLSPF